MKIKGGVREESSREEGKAGTDYKERWIALGEGRDGWMGGWRKEE